MSWLSTLHVGLLFAATGLAVWAAVLARARADLPGAASFTWLMLAVAHWTLTSALHAVIVPVEPRIAIAMVQYIGISAVPPLWLMFASQYARASWIADRTLVALLWLLPAVTVTLAFTNPWHGLLWEAVVPVDGGARLRYDHGPWFWVALAYSYALLLTGTVVMVRAIRRFRPPLRRQTILVLAGALTPWAGNVVYVTRLLPVEGLDVTPLAFAGSGAFIVWGLYRHRVLGLVPIARDLLIDSMDDAVLVLNPERRIVDLNRSARLLTGCRDEDVGRSIDAVIAWWGDTVAEGAATTTAPAIVAAGAQPRYFEVQVTPVRDGHGRFSGWLVRIRDVTARRLAEAERRGLERRVQEQQRLESLSVLAGGVAHDFNNLLTGILGNADLLAIEADAGSRLRESANAIVLGAQRAASLVDQMLAYAGEGRVVSELVDLDALVGEMLDLLRASVARHSEVVHESAGPLPRIRADATQIRQIVLNLIANAADAVEDGGRITVRTELTPVTAEDIARMTAGTAATPGLHVLLEVGDNGAGMPPETLARIFDPFFSTKASGRGLGLAAVHGIVRGHRGGLSVVSVPGEGTRVRVWLPVVTADHGTGSGHTPALTRPAAR